MKVTVTVNVYVNGERVSDDPETEYKPVSKKRRNDPARDEREAEIDEAADDYEY